MSDTNENMKSIALKKGYYIIVVLAFCSLRGFAQPGSSNIEFVENKGQWDPRVRYVGQIGIGSLFLERGGFTTLLYHPDDLARLEGRHGIGAAGAGASAGGAGTASAGIPDNILRAHAYRVRFLGANDQPEITAGQTVAGIQQLFSSAMIRRNGRPAAKSIRASPITIFIRVIDIRYYTNNGQLKYDLIIHPGADVSRIRMRYDGVSRLSRKKEQLIASTSVGDVTQLAPYSYTFDPQRGRTDIRCRYIIGDSNTVSFDVQDHDPSATLIIDPTIVFCSFTGSKISNWGFTATPAPDGSFYAGGIVFGNAYPYNTGQVQAVYGGDPFDVGIMKFTPNGANKVYATFLGGSNAETPASMISDPQGNLVVLGRTYSPDFPFKTTAGAGGGADIFVAKISCGRDAPDRLSAGRRRGG